MPTAKIFVTAEERASREAAYWDYIDAELEKSIHEAADPNSRRFSQAEMVEILTRQREARNTA